MTKIEFKKGDKVKINKHVRISDWEDYEGTVVKDFKDSDICVEVQMSIDFDFNRIDSGGRIKLRPHKLDRISQIYKVRPKKVTCMELLIL